MKKEKNEAILSESPLVYAEKGLALFMEDKLMWSFNMGGGPADEKITKVEGKDYLLNYRSARDKREPTEEELKLRVKLTYLYEYKNALKQYIQKLRKEAWNLK